MMLVFTEDGVLRRPFRLLAAVTGYLLAGLVGLATATATATAE